MMQSTALLDDRTFDASTPLLRGDAIIRRFENEAVVWSPMAPAPLHLDPIAALVLQLLDGDTSIGELTADVRAVLGIPEPIIRSQLRRAVSLLEDGAMFATSPRPETPDGEFDIFPAPPNP